MAHNSQNIYFGSFKVPISATSDTNALQLEYNLHHLNTVQDNIIRGPTFQNPSSNIMFGSFSENYPIPTQIPMDATFSNQFSPQNIAFTSFSAGQQNYMGPFMSAGDFQITPISALQQNNSGGISTLIPNARSDGDLIPPCPQMKQINHSSFNGSPGMGVGINHTGTSSNGTHNANKKPIGRSRKRSRSAAMAIGSSSNSRPNKRIRFRFSLWKNEEHEIMKQEIPKFFPTSILDTCKKIAVMLPEKSIRDVSMYIRSLVTKGIVEDIWDWEDASPRTDLRDYQFYLPDDPDDPDLVNIRKTFNARAGENSMG
ncbi:hypothetical protein DCAR_0415503 [Daucus carota subsp. sativus]|uniref:Uncharacterized protein n=1 Tax=Daucus carota subsp. sativus TaxID=79200 RepID=A0AAF0WU68_DAUCS|nr:hypothetical protein DCAR_0415503 [Daucus carota subsp. sativus]